MVWGMLLSFSQRMKKGFLMNFRTHSALAGKHALLSPSNYHWLNYSEQKLESRYFAAQAAARGTALHLLAHNAIQLGVKIAGGDKTLAAYVKDGIGYRMTVEQPLYYSDNCFGHADTISFRNKKLRIHDLKTGLGKTSEKQLEVYAALFCLEYGISPFDIDIELRIYQNGEVNTYIPDPDYIIHIMDVIIVFDRHIELLKEVNP